MPYDKTNPTSIETYAKKLTGKTFLDILNQKKLELKEYNKCIEKYGNPNRKGGLGNFLEEIYFGYKANSDSNPDFLEALVELKVSPYKLTKKDEYRAGERLVITMIDYKHPVEEQFLSSHLWLKAQKILLIYYWKNEKIIKKLEYQIDFVSLFSPSAEDLKIIKNDYNKIIGKIKEGKAHELSESDTIYLGACTKGATAQDRVLQYYNPSVEAKPRAFSFKQSYMSFILNDLFITVKNEAETILLAEDNLDKISFEEYVLNRLNPYKGQTDEELCRYFNYPYTKNKAQWTKLSYLMLGIKSNRATEFEKANIVVKTIRLEENNKIKENMSFPAFEFEELIKEEWEESTVYSYFEETKFLFIVYKKEGADYIFSYAKFWNMPVADLEGEVKECWENTINRIKNGVTLTEKDNGIFNNLPKKSENRIMHVRPHAKLSAYCLENGVVIGNVDRDAERLPDGRWMTRQSFWLNNSYIEGII